MQFSGVKILMRINSLGSLKGDQYGLRLGPHEKVYKQSDHGGTTTRAWEIQGWWRQRSWDIMSPSERSAPPGIHFGLRVEENSYEPKIYHKNLRGKQDAARPETDEKKRTGIQKGGRFTDENVGTK